VTGGWTIDGVLRDLARRGRHPAVISFGENGLLTCDSAALAARTLRLVRGLRECGVGRGTAVALWAPNTPMWIVAALAVLAAGGTLVPVDDLADPDQFAAAIESSRARLVLTTAQHFARCSVAIHASGTRAILLDDGALPGCGAASWQSLSSEPAAELPDVAADDPAVLSWTSGTTGAPKAFQLSHRNIATNVEALRQLGVVGRDDRALLPLPMHHAYPFVVGVLTTLTIGVAIVLPGEATGPSLMRALREAGVTTIIGVPRLYEALAAAIAAGLDARGRAIGLLLRALLRLVVIVQRASGVSLGRCLFRAVRRGVAPRLRLLVSGGARLEQRVEEELRALGWQVLSGYGLAETASLFTGNRPGARRAGSAGRPLADGEIRIAEPDVDGIGEIELRGSSITRGYLGNPDANRAAFTADGWFRTGDLGFIDRDGFLYVTGRIKETLVLGGGKKVNPEELERLYAAAPEIAEIAVLEYDGALVALARPNPMRLHGRGATNIRDGIRVILGETAQRLPSHQRLAGFALTNEVLPRTRLGKYRRFQLPALYARALAGSSGRVPHPPTTEDEALLREPAAAAVWQLLRRHFPDRPLDLDIDLSLDLNLDSFGWMELSVLLQEQAGVRLAEADFARTETIRDLLRVSIDRHAATSRLPRGEPAFTLDAGYWLAPTGLALTALGALLYAANRTIMRGLFRLRVGGLDRLPETGPFVITPNHISYLDGLVVAAALPWSRLRRLYWSGDALRLFPNPLTRVFCRAAHFFPVDAMHPGTALDTANRVLAAGDILVWFPEGWRSPDGRLQHFLPGIGQLLLRSGAPAVPALIGGTFEALPRNRRLPRLHPLTISFGDPAPAGALRPAGSGATDQERVTDGLRRRLLAIAAE
jgi:long-chain acyl-CoA synthetase